MSLEKYSHLYVDNVWDTIPLNFLLIYAIKLFLKIIFALKPNFLFSSKRFFNLPLIVNVYTFHFKTWYWFVLATEKRAYTLVSIFSFVVIDFLFSKASLSFVFLQTFLIFRLPFSNSYNIAVVTKSFESFVANFPNRQCIPVPLTISF